MKAELKEHYPEAIIRLIEGSGGIFDVKCDTKLIYSKQNVEGRLFPSEGEITRLIKEETG